MANYTTDAINIKSYNLNEADKIMVMYSKDRGLIRCVAKGAKKPKSTIGGRMELLIANKLLISKRKNLDVIYQADGLDTFIDSRKDITKLTYTMYCSELINCFCIENDSNSAQIYNLLYMTFANIAKSQTDSDVLANVVRFQLELMELTGYAIELDTCIQCNSNPQHNYSFCAESGGIVCSNCNPNTQNNNFNEDIRNSLKQLQNGLSTDEFSLKACFLLLKNYVALRCHKKIKTTDMIESLCS